MSLTILRPGLLTTIQDRGRYGYRQYGVIVSGAMDQEALRLGNMLVGNEEFEAGIEITLMGPDIRFEENLLVAITGGDLTPAIDGEPVPMWRPVLVRKGSVLTFGAPKTGCRTYITVAGGFEVPSPLGSKSTYLRAEIGGVKGRTLQTDDVLTCGRLSPMARQTAASLQPSLTYQPFAAVSWTLSPALLPAYDGNVRAMKGEEFDQFTESSRQRIWQEPFRVTPQSDRMGYRLEGPELALTKPAELLSAAVAFGTVQVPAGGNPIILMADHQTTGGYPRIAQVASIDFPALAQTMPGKCIALEEISLQDAQRLYLQREKEFQYIKRLLEINAG